MSYESYNDKTTRKIKSEMNTPEVALLRSQITDFSLAEQNNSTCYIFETPTLSSDGYCVSPFVTVRYDVVVLQDAKFRVM